MDELAPHIERLRRHYEYSVRTYDLVSFLDLSHSLRMWVDLKNALPSINPKFKSALSFRTGCPTRKILKAVAGSEYIFCYMPGGTVTYASQGQLVSGPGNDGEQETFGVKVRVLNSGTEMSHFCYVSEALDEKNIKALGHERVSRCNYENWLGGEAVRYRFKEENGILIKSSISREILIKRVANTMDGSHPSINPQDGDDNKFDKHIEYLMKFQWGGLPLPYFVLLQSAQVILSKITPKGLVT